MDWGNEGMGCYGPSAWLQKQIEADAKKARKKAKKKEGHKK